MARRQVGVVIACLARLRVPAIGLDRGKDIAETEMAEREMIAADGGIGLRSTPGGKDFLTRRLGELPEQGEIIGKRENRRRGRIPCIPALLRKL